MEEWIAIGAGFVFAFVIAVALAWLIFEEPITLRVALGNSLIVLGLAIVARN